MLSQYYTRPTMAQKRIVQADNYKNFTKLFIEKLSYSEPYVQAGSDASPMQKRKAYSVGLQCKRGKHIQSVLNIHP